MSAAEQDGKGGHVPGRPAPNSRATEAGEDFYYEGELVVFTAAYHLKRGYCCGSGCRHCPYEPEDRPAGIEKPPRAVIGSE
jgi:hypothetical protein